MACLLKLTQSFWIKPDYFLILAWISSAGSGKFSDISEPQSYVLVCKIKLMIVIISLRNFEH